MARGSAGGLFLEADETLEAAARVARDDGGGDALGPVWPRCRGTPARSTGTSAGAPASAVSLADAFVPADVRAALGDAARAMIAAAFPAAVTNLSDATALVAPGTPSRPTGSDLPNGIRQERVAPGADTM